jgi:thymidine phosphorylase
MHDFLADIAPAVAACGLTVPSLASLGVEG